MEQNWKLKQLVDSLRKHPKVRETKSNPLVFKWLEPISQSDASDAPDARYLNVISNRHITSDKEDVATPISKSTSGTSGTSYGNQDFPPKCYWCDFSHFGTKEKYDYHCVTRHPGKLAYPGPADIIESGLTPQGMLWEISLRDLKKNGDEVVNHLSSFCCKLKATLIAWEHASIKLPNNVPTCKHKWIRFD